MVNQAVKSIYTHLFSLKATTLIEREKKNIEKGLTNEFQVL